MTNVLAIDIGTKTGYCITEGNKIVGHGCVNFAVKSKQNKFFRLVKFRDWLESIIIDHQIDLVVYEKVRRHLSTESAHLYGAFEALIGMKCFENGIKLQHRGVSEIKKYISGTGRAKKEHVINGVNARGFKITDDNEADAIALALLFLKVES